MGRCTDVGTRVIVAILIGALELGGDAPGACRILTQAKVEADGRFNGPPYAVAEIGFDEDDLKGCTPAPVAESSD